MISRRCSGSSSQQHAQSDADQEQHWDDGHRDHEITGSHTSITIVAVGDQLQVSHRSAVENPSDRILKASCGHHRDEVADTDCRRSEFTWADLDCKREAIDCVLVQSPMMNISSMSMSFQAAGEEEQTHGDESTDGSDDEWSLSRVQRV